MTVFLPHRADVAGSAWPRRFPSLLASALGLALLLPATGHAAPPVTVSQPWFRYLLPQVPAGGYMTLTNSSDQPAVLTGAASPACGMLMLHRTENNGGTESMVAVASITVPANGTFHFAPGGYHLMCMQPKMKPGESVPVTLTFSGDEHQTVMFPVQNAKGQ
jgi:periplasmic copper chaperone A